MEEGIEKERAKIRRHALEEGFEQGIEQGIVRERQALMRAMHANGYAPDVIAHLFGVTVEQVNALLTDEAPDV